MACLVVNGQSWAPGCSECPCSTLREEHLSKFERRKKEAASQATAVRLTWVFLHASIICSLFTVDTNLSRAWNRAHLLYLSSYFLLAIANLALYVNLCISNPGYLQPGVHALSLSSMKRDGEASIAEEDAAEQGIGRLAHIDIPWIGRRAFPGAQQRDRQGKGTPTRVSTLDRTSTLPNLPSHFTAEALLDVTSPGRPWDDPPAGRSKTHEGILQGSETRLSSNCAEAEATPATSVLSNGISSPLDGRSGPFVSKTASKVRVRGCSLGCEQDLVSAFGQGPPEWVDRDVNDASEPLLGKENRAEKAIGSGKPGSPARSGDDASLHRKPSKPLSPSTLDACRTMSWWEGPNPGRWCEYCGAWQLLRSRHCHDCGRCVRRFDHHCAWVGRCIGQDNHLMFWWYLVVQLALLSWTTHVIVEGFEMPARLSVARFVTLLTCCVPAVLLTAFVAVLFGYHTYLVVTAQTTYELMLGSDGCAGSKVPYMRHLPQGKCPFSQGPTQNVLHFCCDRGSTAYQMPAALTAR